MTQINTSKAPLDLTGHRFGRLVAVKLIGKVDKKSYAWACICDCGNQVVVRVGNLRSGNSESCGCVLKERNKSRATHQQVDTAEYHAWAGIKQRCTNPKNPAYMNYGGRGIIVHPSWLDDFAAFRDYVGPRPSANHSIERIDNDGHYVPGNIIWADKRTQARNRRTSNLVTIEGITKTVMEWAEIAGIKAGTLYERVRREVSSEYLLAKRDLRKKVD